MSSAPSASGTPAVLDRVALSSDVLRAGGTLVRAIGYTLFFLMLFLPTVYQPLKGALLGLTLVGILSTAAVTGRFPLAPGIALGALGFSALGLASVLRGLTGGAPGALAMFNVYVLWPLVYTLLVAGASYQGVLRGLTRITVYSSLAISLYSVIFVLREAGLWPSGLYYAFDQGQAIGFYSTHTEFGLYSTTTLMFLVPYLVGALFVFPRAGAPVGRPLLWLSMVLSFTTVLLSGRRALLLLVLLAPALALLFRAWLSVSVKRESRRLVRRAWWAALGVAVLLIAIMTAIGGIAPAGFVDMVASGFRFNSDVVAMSRRDQFVALVAGWLQQPVFGSGHGAPAPGVIRSIETPWAYRTHIRRSAVPRRNPGRRGLRRRPVLGVPHCSPNRGDRLVRSAVPHLDARRDVVLSAGQRHEPVPGEIRFDLGVVHAHRVHQRLVRGRAKGQGMTDAIATAEAPLCTVCGATGTLEQDGLRDTLYGVPGHWQYRRCGSCGLLWQDPMVTEDAVASLYTRYYTHASAAMPAPSLARRLYAGVRLGYLANQYGYPADGVWQRLAGHLLRLHPGRRADADFTAIYLPASARGRLLDVGCGRGETMEALAALGWDVRGIDPDPKAVEVARDRGLQAECGTIWSDALDPGFDAIWMSHVIEHVHRPVEMLRRCCELLAPGRTLVAVTPNSKSWGYQVFGGAWRGLEPPRHLQVFSRQALIAAARHAGFAEVDVRVTIRNARGIHYMSQAIREAERTGTLVDPPAPTLGGEIWQGT